MNDIIARAERFAARSGLRVPVLLAPMAGASPPALSIAVAKAGGLGACGALLMQPSEIAAWADDVRTEIAGPFQLNLWIPDPPAVRDPQHEAAVRAFLADWGPPVPPDAGDVTPPDFDAQCEALLAARPAIVSSVMGLYPAPFVERLKAHGISWFAIVSTVTEARAAASAGADAIVAQGAEAGGHRGCFDAAAAERELVGLFALLPAVVDAVPVPVIATGGIADARGMAAALALGASAVQLGTRFLRCPEAQIHPAWASALAHTLPEQTALSRVFSGRAGRSIATDYVRAARSERAPVPAPYPVQRGLTTPMRRAAQAAGDVQRMQAWAGQSAALGNEAPAADVVQELWSGARCSGTRKACSMDFDLTIGTAVLQRTPETLRAMLAGLPPAWTDATEGPNTWSPYVIVGHLIHGERTDWIPRAELIRIQGAERRFPPFDRFAQFHDSEGRSLAELLDTFARLRAESLATLAGWHLTDAELALEGEHPEFGIVTLRQLLATWVAHDLGHVAQVARVMAKQYREAVGPWRTYLPILDR